MFKPPKLVVSDMVDNKKKQFPWSALASVGGSLISGLFGSADNDDINRQNMEIAKLNYKSQQETNQWNKLIADKANETNISLQSMMNGFNREMWDLNNEYNSPVQQLQRAAAAGINPNIVFGQPVASSPVQQTSIPNQVTPHMEAPLMNFNPISKGKYKFLQELGNMFAKLPFNKASLDIMREEARGKRVENDTKEYELQNKKDADNFYGGNSYYTATDGSDRVLTHDEFDRLSDSDKKAFLNRDMPYVTINGEKKPNYNASQLPFRNKATFEAYKEVQALPNFIQNVRADRLQNSLREYVAKNQISAKDKNGNPSVIYAIAHMPEIQYDNLLQTYRNLVNENNWNIEDRDLNKKILDLQYEQIKRNSEHDFFKYIDKIGSGEMTAGDWIKMLLVGIHDMLGGASQFIRKR